MESFGLLNLRAVSTKLYFDKLTLFVLEGSLSSKLFSLLLILSTVVTHINTLLTVTVP